MPNPYDVLEARETKTAPCIRCGVHQAPSPLIICRQCYEETQHPSNLVGIAEIAERAGVTKVTVQQWRQRHADFPAPEVQLAATPVWRWPTIERWLRETGRMEQGMTNTLYVYDTETDEPHPIVAVYEGADNRQCEEAADRDWPSDRYGQTYSPAIGSNDGLVWPEGVEVTVLSRESEA